jgi:hypothetical protein
MDQNLDVTNSRAIEALIAAAHDAGIADAYCNAMSRVRSIASETTRAIAELEAREHRTAA